MSNSSFIILLFPELCLAWLALCSHLVHSHFRLLNTSCSQLYTSTMSYLRFQFSSNTKLEQRKCEVLWHFSSFPSNQLFTMYQKYFWAQTIQLHIHKHTKLFEFIPPMRLMFPWGRKVKWINKNNQTIVKMRSKSKVRKELWE